MLHDQATCDGQVIDEHLPEKLSMDTAVPDHILDITHEICPMTFVRTRVALDSMQAGAVLSVRLSGEEARRNVPATARQLGHEVLSEETEPDGVTTLLLRKKPE